MINFEVAKKHTDCCQRWIAVHLPHSYAAIPQSYPQLLWIMAEGVNKEAGNHAR